MRAPGQRRISLLERWRAWVWRRRASRNQWLLEAGRAQPDEPESGRDPQPPVTDVFTWLGRNRP
jgi:hypothetical protein